MIEETREYEYNFSTSHLCFVDELCRVNEIATFRIVRRIYRSRVCATNRRSSLFLAFISFLFFFFYSTQLCISIWTSVGVGVFSTNSNFAHSLCTNLYVLFVVCNTRKKHPEQSEKLDIGQRKCRNNEIQPKNITSGSTIYELLYGPFNIATYTRRNSRRRHRNSVQANGTRWYCL